MNEELKRILEHSKKISRLARQIGIYIIVNPKLIKSIEREVSKIQRDLEILMNYNNHRNI